MREADAILVAFTRALRHSGLAVSTDRTRAYLEAVDVVGLSDRVGVVAAGHATLCASPDDLDRHDRMFEMFFSDGALPSRAPEHVTATPEIGPGQTGDDGKQADEEPGTTSASATELLRRRDLATVSAAERQRLASLFASLRLNPPTRRTARRVASRRGRVDASRTMRASLRCGGEPAAIRWRRRGTRERRVIALIDVSGSMSSYSDPLLRVAHRMVATSPRSAEVFTIGTRLTRVTRALRTADPDEALAAAGEVVPDWSGGTRIGETLRVFLDRWGQSGLARGAVVVICSDGWERGDPALLAEQTARLRRMAHRVVWVNPHQGKAGYEPLQRGIAAVLPLVDDFVAGHSLATYYELMEVIRRA